MKRRRFFLTTRLGIAIALLTAGEIWPAENFAGPQPQVLPDGIRNTQRAADLGDAVAQLRVGLAHANGVKPSLFDGLPRRAFIEASAPDVADEFKAAKDLEEAARWFRKSAEQGNAAAQCQLAEAYRQGHGLPRDLAEAVQWFRRAAEQGDAEGQLRLGFAYSSGEGVAEDRVEAANWYRKAAEQGNRSGQAMLGLAYGDGRGVPLDPVEAIHWLGKAADQGDTAAQMYVGRAYAAGMGVPKDDAQAAKWFRRAAVSGITAGQFELGMACYRGTGVPRDLVEAYSWLNLAAAQQYETAAKQRDSIAKEMSPSQIAEAQRMSGEFRPHRGLPERPSADPASAVSESAPSATGTGFFISEDGWLVTNAHVVEGGSTVRIATRKGRHTAVIVRRDEANDLALLKITGSFAAVPIAPSRLARLGNTVATVGFPNVGLQGFSPKLAKGEIASLAGAQDDPKHFQISVPLQPGNSGGALVDSRGNAVGVIVAKLDQRAALATSGALAENVNYAIKSSYLLSLIESVPGLGSRLREPAVKLRPFEELVADLEKATALVLVYK